MPFRNWKSRSFIRPTSRWLAWGNRRPLCCPPRIQRGDGGAIQHLWTEAGNTLSGDLFIDCSGFASSLLAETPGVQFTSYASSLPCDAAVIGSWKRSGGVLPYTTAETMDHGWCWRIEFPRHVTRGYVFSTQFCQADQAMRELKTRNPEIDDDLRLVSFRRGRYERFWAQNVVAIGNSSGFVEPLEATALYLIVEQIRLLCRVLGEGDLRLIDEVQAVANQRFRELWDEVRDFLAIHYRFNRKRETEFWRHCRKNVDLAGAAALVEFYQAAGPSTLSGALLPSGRIFGYDGFMSLLIGQRAPTRFANSLDDADRQAYQQFRQQMRRNAQRALPMDQALGRLRDPRWRWPEQPSSEFQ